MAQDPATWRRHYDRVQGVAGGAIIELELGGGPRLFVHCGEQLTLVRMGEHDLTQRIRDLDLHHDLATAGPAPEAFQRPVFPPPARGFERAVLPHERTVEWLFFLGPAQLDVAARIEDHIIEDWLNDKPSAHLIIGGPGTGKTVVLLWLMKRLAASSPATRDEFDVRLALSTEMQHFVTNAVDWDLDSILGIHATGRDLLLVDDPPTFADVEAAVRRVAAREARSCVIALDPFQLGTTISDRLLTELERTFGVERHVLQECYRQRRHLGESVAGLLEPAFRRQRDTKMHDLVERLSRQLTFPTEGGVVSHASSWTEVLKSAAGWAGKLWRFAPAVLLVVDDAVDIDEELEPLRRLIGSEAIHIAKLSDATTLRGLEYQHAVIVLSERTSRHLSAVDEADAATLQQYRLIRIPLTRPRDSITYLVVA